MRGYARARNEDHKYQDGKTPLRLFRVERCAVVRSGGRFNGLGRDL